MTPITRHLCHRADLKRLARGLYQCAACNRIWRVYIRRDGSRGVEDLGIPAPQLLANSAARETTSRINGAEILVAIAAAVIVAIILLAGVFSG